jgi:hypothetical protein
MPAMHVRLFPVLFFAVRLLLAAVPAPAQQPAPGPASATLDVPFSRPPAIDGAIGEKEWRKAARIDSLRPSLDHADDPRPLPPTTVFLAHDRTHLYVAFDCVDDDIDFVEGRFAHDDALYNGDVVEAYLDAGLDGRCYVELECAPDGTTLDALHTFARPPAIGPDDKADAASRRTLVSTPAWEMEGWRTAAVRTETGWSVEMAIPFATLPRPAAEGAAERAILRTDGPAPLELRAQFVRYDRLREGPSRKRLLHQAWTAIREGSPHVTPHRMGTLRLVPPKPFPGLDGTLLAGALMAIVTGLSWVVVGVVSSHAAQRGANYALVQWLTNLFSMLAVTGLLLAAGGTSLRDAFLPEAPRRAAALSIFAFGFINYYMLAVMNEAMRRGPHGLTWTITQSGFILPFLMGGILFPEKAGWTLLRVAGIVAILFNVFVDGLSKRAGDDAAPATKGWFPLAFAALLLCGANQCFVNLPSYWEESRQLPVMGRMAWSGIGAFAGLATHAIFSEGPRRLAAAWPEFRVAAAGAATITVVNTVVSLKLYYVCMDRLAAANAGAIALPLMVGACFCGFFLYSAFVLRERTTTLQKIAFAGGLAGIAFLCL